MPVVKVVNRDIPFAFSSPAKAFLSFNVNGKVEPVVIRIAFGIPFRVYVYGNVINFVSSGWLGVGLTRGVYPVCRKGDLFI